MFFELYYAKSRKLLVKRKTFLDHFFGLDTVSSLYINSFSKNVLLKNEKPIVVIFNFQGVKVEKFVFCDHIAVIFLREKMLSQIMEIWIQGTKFVAVIFSYEQRFSKYCMINFEKAKRHNL